MSDRTDQPTTRLWTESGFIDDEWRHTDDASDGAGGRLILPLAAWLELDDATRAAATHGVLLAPGEALEPILPHLAVLPLVALAFPAYNDGRSYSKAELLRRRHGYRGIIRAVGDVLIDQIPLMMRTGFSQFEVANPTALKRLAEGRIGGLPIHYQPSGRADETAERYSWRRKPAA